MAINQVYFGFLPYEGTIEFDGGVIPPVPEYDKVVAWVEKYTNHDGFLYPPVEKRVILDPRTGKPIGQVPKTKRPALLHKIPPSHELCLTVTGTSDNIRKGPGAFIIHLFAYLFQTRLQFDDWWFDGRVPIRRPRSFDLNKDTVQDLMSHSYRTWQGWNARDQRLITNLLYMHSRIPLYAWDWEQFTLEYMVLDGCWNLAAQLYGVVAKKHKERIKILCDTFHIPYNNDLIKRIVDLRNELFHETLWDGSQPCTAVSIDAFQQVGNLRRLNQRIIPALLGYKTPFIKTSWCSLSASWFERQAISEHI